MTKTENTRPTYRTADLPGLGQVQVPAGISDAEILEQVLGKDAEATPAKKAKKKP